MPSNSKYQPASITRGAIVWLPKLRFIKAPLPDLPAEVFDHPVLIFGIPEPDQVDVFLVTSFKAGSSLIGKYQTDPKFRSRQLPLHPAPPHPDNGVLLALANGRAWPKQSFVSLSLFRVPAAALREEQQGPWKVSEESMGELDRVVEGLPRARNGVRKGEDGEAEGGGEWGQGGRDGEEGTSEEEGWVVVCRKRRRSAGGSDGVAKEEGKNSAARL